MKKLFLIITYIFLLLAPVNLWAACTGSSPNWTTTPDYASVNTCVGGATAGDTINVTAGDGTETWNSALTITKGIYLLGPGLANLTITNNQTGTLITYAPANYDLNTPFRISGFTFNLDNKSRWLTLGHSAKYAPFTIQTSVRIDHNSIINAPNNVSAAYIWDFGGMHGVVDNNNFSGAYYGFKSDPAIQADRAWYQYSPQKDFVSGSSNYLYFEDNTVSLTTTNNILQESQYGGRYAWRYNTITGGASYSLFEGHGHQSEGASGMPAHFGAEIYGNLIINTYGNLYKVRGGKSFVFLNDMVLGGGYSTAYDGLVACPSEVYDDPIAEMIHDTYLWGNRNGYTGSFASVGADHTAGLSCNGLDNIPTLGRDVFSDTSSPGVTSGTLANIPGTCTTGQGYWATNQSTSDLTAMVGVNPSTPISGTFYKCTATNTWTSYYTPLTYPHPLRTEDVTPPVMSNPLPSGVQQCTSNPCNITLALTTNENANCKYGTSDTTYALMTSTYGTGQGTTAHSQVISLACNANYTYYSRCQDTSPNLNTNIASATHSFSIAPTSGDVTPPVMSNAGPTSAQNCVAGGPVSVPLTVMATDETQTVVCKYHPSDVAYDSMSGTFGTKVGDNFSHSVSLACGQTITYYYRCADGVVPPNKNTSSISATFDVLAYSPPGVIEAESVVEVSPMAEVSDVTASGGKYIATTTAYSGTATYTVNAPVTGDYRIRARVWAIDTGADSFYLTVNALPEINWSIGLDAVFNTWKINNVCSASGASCSEYHVTLTAGNHIFVFRGREIGARLDYFALESVAIISPPPIPQGLMIVGSGGPFIVGSGGGGGIGTMIIE